MGALISRRKRAKVDTKDVSTQPIQPPKKVEYLETKQATGSAGDSLIAVLQAIDNRLNAQQLHAPQDEKSSLTVWTRTTRQGEEDTSDSGGFASQIGIFAVPGTNTHANMGVQAAGEAGDGCAYTGADAHGSPEVSTGKSRTKRSHFVKDQQPSFHFRAPKITPSREGVRSLGEKPYGIPRLPTADAGEPSSASESPTSGGPKENVLVLEVNSSPKDAEVVPEVKDVVQPRRKEHMVVDEVGLPSILGYVWQPRELSSPHKKSACRRSSRRKHKTHTTPNLDLRVWYPQTLEEELEMLSVEEIIQAGSNSRFQGDVLEVEAMTATGGFVSCTLAKLMERSGEQRRPGFGEASRMQFQKVNFGQGMWPLEQTADNFVQEDQDTGDETDSDIAEDTLDCNVDDRMSSPPVCCGCEEVDWDTLKCETVRSVAPPIDNCQPGGNSERKATGTMDSTQGCEERARGTEATTRQAKSQVASELLTSPKTSDANKTYLPPLPARENKYIPHWNRNSPCGENKDEEVGTTLCPASKMADEDVNPRQLGGGDSPIVSKEGDVPEGAVLSSSSRNSKPEIFMRRLSASGPRLEKSCAQRKVSFDSTSDTYLLQLDVSSNRPTSRECEEETSPVLQDQFLLQYFQSLQITEEEQLQDSHQSRDVDAKFLVPPLDLDAALCVKSSNEPDVIVSTPDGLDSNRMSHLREGGDSGVRAHEKTIYEQENYFHSRSVENHTQLSVLHSARDLESDSYPIFPAVNYATSPTSISVISEEQPQAHTCLSSFTSLVSIGIISEEESQARACISSTPSLVNSDIIYEGHQYRISSPACTSLSKTSIVSATEPKALGHTASLQDLYSLGVLTDCVNRVMGENGSAGRISCLDESSTNPEDDVHFRDGPKDKCVPAGNGNVNESNISGLPGILEHPQIDEMQTNKKNWLPEIPEEANPDEEQHLWNAGLILVQGKAPTYLASLTECENIGSGEQMQYGDHDEALLSRRGRSQRAARIYEGFAFSSLRHSFSAPHSLKTTDYCSQMLQHN